MLGILYDLGLAPTDAIAAVDVIGQYVFGTTLAYVNRLSRAEPAAEVPATGGESGIDPADFPHLARAITEADYLGWDAMFDRGLRALVRGLVVDRDRRGRATPTPGQEKRDEE